MDPHTATEVAYKNGFDTGLKAGIDRMIERLTAKSGITVSGVPHYVATDHDLTVIKQLILEELSHDPNP